MTVFAPSDFISTSVPAEAGGCGTAHVRDVGTDQVWGLCCGGGCEDWLLAHDDRWVKDVHDVRPTFDEKKALERFRNRGQADRDALMALAMARMAGLSQAEIPPSLTKMLSGLPAHVPGVVVCGSGHDNRPGSRYCSQCGTAMTRPAVAGELAA